MSSLYYLDSNTKSRKRIKNLGKSEGTLHTLFASIFALKIADPTPWKDSKIM